MSDQGRPFRVLGVQQVAIGGPTRAPLRRLWCDLLGVAKVGDYRSAAENVAEDILSLGKGAFAVEVDLMEPIDASRAPKVHEPALNHVGLWVDDLHAAYAFLEAQGVRFAPGGIRKGAAGHDVCFIHPKPSSDRPESGQGVLIELVQAPPEVMAALSQP
jgi:lactoylglutathione lyase